MRAAHLIKYYPGGKLTNVTSNIQLLAAWVSTYTLTVNPNGGIYNSTSANSTFSGTAGATKVLGSPSSNASYTISYNANGVSGATYTGSPTAVARSFSSWTKSGSGTLSSGTYTYGSGNGTVTANYNTTSDYLLGIKDF